MTTLIEACSKLALTEKELFDEAHRKYGRIYGSTSNLDYAWYTKWGTLPITVTKFLATVPMLQEATQPLLPLGLQ